MFQVCFVEVLKCNNSGNPTTSVTGDPANKSSVWIRNKYNDTGSKIWPIFSQIMVNRTDLSV